jgi:hypothetical protein
MVHALESAGDLVIAGGIVIVVHDGRTPPTIEIQQGLKHTTVGWLQDHEGFPMVRRADQAVDSVIDSGRFTPLNQSAFVYRTLIDSLVGFNEWLDKKWETSYLPADTKEEIEVRFLEGKKDMIVVVHRQARIRSLRVG